MAMHHQHLVCIIVLVASSSLLQVTSAATAYDVLEQNNLPRGLLPQGLTSFALSNGGKMVVTLPGECNFFVTMGGQQYKFRYGSTVGGVVENGSIREVYGVRIQMKFGWLGISQVQRAGDQLTIQAQGFSQPFPVSAFAQSPSCSN